MRLLGLLSRYARMVITMFCFSLRLVTAGLATWLALGGLAFAADEQGAAASSATTGAPAGSSAQTAEVKRLFAAQCGWCHNDYGMKAGKGPKLAGTRMNEKPGSETVKPMPCRPFAAP